MKRVAVLVGHEGPGTGAEFDGRDEWTLCVSYADELLRLLDEDGVLEGVGVVIDSGNFPWSTIRKVSKVPFWSRWTNIDLRIEAVRDLGPFHAAVELHLNSFLDPMGLRTASGMEVFIRRKPGPKTRRLGTLLHQALAEKVTLKDRGLKRKSFRVLRGLHNQNIPAALIEPAFLVEDRTVSAEWRSTLARALSEGLYKYFGG